MARYPPHVARYLLQETQTAARLLTEIPQRALAVFAHPDDLEVSCGGTVAGWALAGCEVTLVVCTRGDKGSLNEGTNPDALATQRGEEARASAQVLGAAHVELLGFDDGEVENTSALRRLLVGVIRRHRPDVVLMPDPTALIFGSTYVNHHDHRSVGAATLDACAPAAASPLYYPEQGAAHRVTRLLLSGTLAPDAWVDITSTVEQKSEALRCHRSQVGDNDALVTDLVRRRAAEEGARAGVSHAESYRCLDLQF